MYGDIEKSGNYFLKKRDPENGGDPVYFRCEISE